MAKIITAPEEYYGLYSSRWPSLFLAGGITGCEDWQAKMLEKLKHETLIIYNPRRENFPIDDQSAAEVQICWEFDKLVRADIVSFWFAAGSLNPIVLYELGLHGNSMPGRPIAVGVDEKYSLKMDVYYQTALARPEVKIVTSLEDLVVEIHVILGVMTGK